MTPEKRAAAPTSKTVQSSSGSARKTGVGETGKKAVTSSPKTDPNVICMPGGECVTTSNALAKLATTSALSAFTLKQYVGCGDELEITDLLAAMKKAGDEAVAGDLNRVERMLANQMLTLDVLFDNLAQRAGKQETFRGMETMMRLALKAQSQARATAETLAVIKHPPPFIQQTNIASGNQQVNNVQHAGAGNSQSAPNKLLEESQHGNNLVTGTQTTASRANQALEAVATVHRSKNA